MGFESNIKINSDRKATKYHPLINHLHSSYSTATFVNLSMSAIGILGTSSQSFLPMLTDLQLDNKAKKNALTIFFVDETKVGQTPIYLPFKNMILLTLS